MSHGQPCLSFSHPQALPFLRWAFGCPQAGAASGSGPKASPPFLWHGADTRLLVSSLAKSCPRVTTAVSFVPQASRGPGDKGDCPLLPSVPWPPTAAPFAGGVSSWVPPGFPRGCTHHLLSLPSRPYICNTDTVFPTSPGPSLLLCPALPSLEPCLTLPTLYFEQLLLSTALNQMLTSSREAS